jgi:hypothetical protein
MLNANANRRQFVVNNVSTSATAWLAFGSTAVAGSGLTLLPGQVFSTALWSGSVQVIGSAVSSTGVTFVEF